MTESVSVPSPNSLVARLWAELILASRFGVVGIAATAIHVLVVWSLIRGAVLPVLAANFVAFLTAFSFSLSGNYYWTFNTPGNPSRAIRRFFLISGGAFAANNFLLAVLLSAAWLSPVVSAVSAATVIPAITFLASRFWGFRDYCSPVKPPDADAHHPAGGSFLKSLHEPYFSRHACRKSTIFGFGIILIIISSWPCFFRTKSVKWDAPDYWFPLFCWIGQSIRKGFWGD
jgi:putative flippase GtrA